MYQVIYICLKKQTENILTFQILEKHLEINQFDLLLYKPGLKSKKKTQQFKCSYISAQTQ